MASETTLRFRAGPNVSSVRHLERKQGEHALLLVPLEVPQVAVVMQAEVSNVVCDVRFPSAPASPPVSVMVERTVLLCRRVDDGGAFVRKAGEVHAVFFRIQLLLVPGRRCGVNRVGRESACPFSNT